MFELRQRKKIMLCFATLPTASPALLIHFSGVNLLGALAS
jgi:hypothetical protein